MHACEPGQGAQQLPKSLSGLGKSTVALPAIAWHRRVVLTGPPQAVWRLWSRDEQQARQCLASLAREGGLASHRVVSIFFCFILKNRGARAEVREGQ